MAYLEQFAHGLDIPTQDSNNGSFESAADFPAMQLIAPSWRWQTPTTDEPAKLTLTDGSTSITISENEPEQGRYGGPFGGIETNLSHIRIPHQGLTKLDWPHKHLATRALVALVTQGIIQGKLNWTNFSENETAA